MQGSDDIIVSDRFSSENFSHPDRIPTDLVKVIGFRDFSLVVVVVVGGGGGGGGGGAGVR